MILNTGLEIENGLLVTTCKNCLLRVLSMVIIGRAGRAGASPLSRAAVCALLRTLS